MSIETSPVTWLPWVTIDGAGLELWECGHWHPMNLSKWDYCRFCYPNGLPAVWDRPAPSTPIGQ